MYVSVDGPKCRIHKVSLEIKVFRFTEIYFIVFGINAYEVVGY